MLRVTIWNEYRHEKISEKVRELFPNGIHTVIGEFLTEDNNGSENDIAVTFATLDDPEQGLPAEVLDSTDVLIWWGHMAHNEVPDSLAARIRDRVFLGMGFVALHSTHHSKPFEWIIGTNGNLSWGREQRTIVWNMMPSHPIAAGIPASFALESEELYAEPFFIPQPDALVFGSWYEDGNIFRSGCCFIRGAGRVFYFQPGHETCLAYFNPHVRRIIKNSVRWAAPQQFGFEIPNCCPYIKTPDVKRLFPDEEGKDA